jgi:hypothetical protein
MPGTSVVERIRNDPGAARLRMALLPFGWMAVQNTEVAGNVNTPPLPPGMSGVGQDGDFFRSGVTGKYVTYPMYIQLACNMGQVLMSIHVCVIRGYSQVSTGIILYYCNLLYISKTRLGRHFPLYIPLCMSEKNVIFLGSKLTAFRL